MRGRKPKPTALKLLHGNPGRRPLNAEEPQPPTGEIKPPSWLKRGGRLAWRWIAPVLKENGLLTTMDPHALALLCDAYAQYIEARKLVQQEGMTYEAISTTGRSILKTRPEVALAAEAWKQVRAMLAEFGMTPSSRSRVKGERKQEHDPLADLLARRKGVG